MTPGPRRCALGLGCVTFGREIDAAAAFAMMDHAAAQGIELFDTAPAYADGGSETIIGRWLVEHGRPAGSPTVATKVLPPYTAGAIRRSVAASLARLGTPRLDLLFLHRWDESLAQAEAHETLADLGRAGTVGALGISNVNDAQLAAALTAQAAAGAARFAWVQNVHNFAVRGFDAALRTRCRDHGIRLMGYSPLGAGFLTGKHRDGVAPGSRFEVIPGHQGVYFHPLAWERLARLEAVAQGHGLTPVELALAWAVHQPWIDLVLVGGRNPGQIEQVQQARDRDAVAVLAELGED
ncbi:MAG: aldo/keto reductase [Verrucomicrobia bacterium]|nr:aldo/keto reductase [Verrucomicrobiota bacterium]